MDHGDQHNGEREAARGNRRERGREAPVGNLRDAADDHILRVAGDGGGAADVRGHGGRQQIGHRIAAQPFHDLDHQRGEHEADRVVDEECRERAGDQHERRQQHEGVACFRHSPIVHQPKESGEAQIGDDDHHAEQQRDGVEIDGPVGGIERQYAEPDHQARAEQRGAGAVEAKARQLADGDDQIGRREDRHRGRGLPIAPKLWRESFVQQKPGHERQRQRDAHGCQRDRAESPAADTCCGLFRGVHVRT